MKPRAPATPPPLMPSTRVAITDPVPTTATTSLSGGKLRLEFEIDLAAEIGRAVLENRKPDVGAIVAKALAESSKALFASVAVARSLPQGQA